MEKEIKHYHILDEKILDIKKLHPLNDKNLFNLKNKTFFKDKLNHDLGEVINSIDSVDNSDSLYRIDINCGIMDTKLKGLEIFIEHTDDGGREFSKKVCIPFNKRDFSKWIKVLKTVAVINIYFPLKTTNSDELVIDETNYVYLVISPEQIYSSKGTYDIFVKGTANPSSRWVTLEDILTCLKTKETFLNEEENVWLVHRENIKHFMSEFYFRECEQQFQKSFNQILDIKFGNTNNEIESKIRLARNRARENLMNLISKKENNEYKCQFNFCNISSKNAKTLICSHIWSVSEIKEQNISEDEKIKYIENPKNCLLLCPTHDKLFDRHFISFDKYGYLLTQDWLKNHLKEYNLRTDRIILNMDKEIEFFMEKHRKAFNKISKFEY